MYEGVWTALWTPTDARGELITDAVKTHLEFLKKAGVSGILIGGSTGEFTRLTLKVRLELISYAKKYAGSLPLFVNISDSIFGNVKELASQAKNVDASGVLVLPPSYYEVTQEDIAAYFIVVSSFTEDLPFFLYNFPECVRNSIELETVRRLVDQIPLAGIKHSGSNLSYTRDLASIKSKKPFSVFVGAEGKLPEALQMGAKGTIGGLSNAIPELILDLFHKSKEGKDYTETKGKIEKIQKVISSLHFPYDVGAVMEARGLDTGALKIPCSRSTLAAQETAIKELKNYF